MIFLVQKISNIQNIQYFLSKFQTSWSYWSCLQWVRKIKREKALFSFDLATSYWVNHALLNMTRHVISSQAKLAIVTPSRSVIDRRMRHSFVYSYHFTTDKMKEFLKSGIKSWQLKPIESSFVLNRRVAISRLLNLWERGHLAGYNASLFLFISPRMEVIALSTINRMRTWVLYSSIK